MTVATSLPTEIRAVLDNGVPLILATCSADGVPNTTIISQAYYVDPEHVALSFQFFSKTIRNVRENPHATLCLNDMDRKAFWLLELEYERSETAGPIFDEMDMQIEAIASATGMSGIFKLRAADIYRVRGVRKVEPVADPSETRDDTRMAQLAEELRRLTEEVCILRGVSSRLNATLNLERIHDIVLHTMHDVFGCGPALILLLDDAGTALRVVASRGYPDPPIGAKVELGVGVIGTVARRKKLMRVGNLSQQRAYVEAIRNQVRESGSPEAIGPVPVLPGLADAQSQMAIPLLIEDRLVGVFFVESAERPVFTERDETLITIVANQSASAIHNAQLYRREEQRREALEGAVAERSRELRHVPGGPRAVEDQPANGARAYDFDEIVGDSRAMSDVRALLRKIVKSPASTILITGANGTGKDLVAKVLHYQSSRATSAFMNITCSALSENLLESELFGHERGAFTDAHKQKKGLLELAHGGTVFLDEIGEMGPSMQAKLLRVLEDKSFKRVGGADDISVDVRIVAATNRDLPRMVREGQFREDLYYRLRVVPIELPRLCDRRGDVPQLTRIFLTQFTREFGKEIDDVEGDAVAALEAYEWPGNVRELRNTVERAVLLAERRILTVEDFQLPCAQAASDPLRLSPTGIGFEELERSLVRQALEMAGWNKAHAARLLGMPRDWLRYRIEKFGLRQPDEA